MFFTPVEAMQTTSQSTSQWTGQVDQSVLQRILERKTPLFAALAAILVLGVAIGVQQSLSQKKTLAASQAFHLAEKQLEKDLKLAGTTAITNVEQQLAESVAKLRDVQTQHGSSLVGWEARFRLASLYLKYGPRSGKAASLFDEASRNAPSAREKVFSLYSLAYALEAQGKFDEAAQKLDEAYQLEQPYLKAEIGLSRARILARAGKGPEADQAYDQVSRDFANTDWGRKAEQLKALRTL
jgi:tetratricopeptide (TPR) repeat protein